MNQRTITTYNELRLFISTSPNGYGRTYFAKNDIKKGEVVLRGFGTIIDHQTSHISIQVNLKSFYLPTKWTGKFFNHSCSPNTFPQTRKDGFPNWIALNDIQKGEEITYAYWTTEYEWGRLAVEKYIQCLCQAENCKGFIYAYNQLSAREKAKYKSRLSKYLSILHN